ncbi:MAG: phage holin family protein [Micromonosporaceae bacterium]
MAETAAPRPDGQPGTVSGSTADESLGNLVSAAIRDISQLVKWEIDLAKLEMRDDIKRLAISGGMLGVAGFVGCLVLVLLSFAAAYGLVAAGLPAWAAFLIVAGAYVLLAGLAVLIGVQKMRRLAGLRRTRTSVQESLAMLRTGDRREGES